MDLSTFPARVLMLLPFHCMLPCWVQINKQIMFTKTIQIAPWEHNCMYAQTCTACCEVDVSMPNRCDIKCIESGSDCNIVDAKLFQTSVLQWGGCGGWYRSTVHHWVTEHLAASSHTCHRYCIVVCNQTERRLVPWYSDWCGCQWWYCHYRLQTSCNSSEIQL